MIGHIDNDISSVFGISLLSEPPKCQICERYVQRVSIGVKPVHLGVLCCKDCMIAWYDGCETSHTIKQYVLERYGELGGEGVGWPTHELPRLRKKSVIQEEIIQALAAKLRSIQEVLSELKLDASIAHD